MKRPPLYTLLLARNTPRTRSFTYKNKRSSSQSPTTANADFSAVLLVPIDDETCLPVRQAHGTEPFDEALVPCFLFRIVSDDVEIDDRKHIGLRLSDVPLERSAEADINRIPQGRLILFSRSFFPWVGCFFCHNRYGRSSRRFTSKSEHSLDDGVAKRIGIRNGSPFLQLHHFQIQPLAIVYRTGISIFMFFILDPMIGVGNILFELALGVPRVVFVIRFFNHATDDGFRARKGVACEEGLSALAEIFLLRELFPDNHPFEKLVDCDGV